MPNSIFRTISFLFALSTAAVAIAADAPAGKLNVLFIATDDWRPEIACYGTKGMKTPNVDRLAASGVRFDRAYCQFPLCNPSRTSMLTGRHPTTTGALDNTVYFRDAHPDWVTLPEYFAQHGYVSARTGKIFHGSIDDPQSWNEIADGRPAGAKPAQPRPANQPRKKQDPAQSDRRVVLEGDGESHQDYLTAVRGIELLEKHKDRPFFVAVGFVKPHSPPTAPKKFYDLFDPAQIELPPDFMARPTVPEGYPVASVPQRNSDLFIGRDASPDEARLMIQAYRASAAWTDWNIGRVLDALDRLLLTDRTIVVFFGDHGYHLGEKGKWSKHGSLFEVGARVPLVVRLPKAAGNGQSSGRTVQLLDLYPTLAELCGLPQPQGLQGHSFVSLLADAKADWTHPAFTVTSNGGRSVRTERRRYAEWAGGREGAMLFDHQNDPHETKNLAADPAQAAVVAEMKSLLAARFPAERKP